MREFAMKLKRYYELGFWDKARLKEAVELGKLSEVEYREIVGEGY